MSEPLIYYEACDKCPLELMECQGHPVPPDPMEEAAKELAEAKRLYAEAFLLYRTKVPTDKQAEAMAEIDHGERVLMAQARLDLARRGV